MTVELESPKEAQLDTTVVKELPFKRNDGSNPLNLSKELLYKKKKELDELQVEFPKLPRDVLAIAWDAHYIQNKELYQQ